MPPIQIKQCRSCNADIVFLKTKKGSFMPVNAETVHEGDDEFDASKGHMTHYATCPTGHQFRRTKKEEKA